MATAGTITKNRLLREITDDYLSSIDKSAIPSPESIELELLTRINDEIDFRNVTQAKENRWSRLQKLDPVQIAVIIATLHPIIRISPTTDDIGSEYDVLAMYQENGPNKGLYVTDDQIIAKIAWSYDYTLKTKDLNEIMAVLKIIAPRKKRFFDKDYIAVNNGIFRYDTKTLEPFDKNKVFLSKSSVDYIANAQNITIHNDEDGTDWDVETWLAELSDDPQVVNLLWEILGAIVRPGVRWNKAAWLYSEVGNNGKGTLCELMRNLCGKGTYASIPLAKFSEDFMLEPLLHASAIIVDENDVGTYIDKAANLKAVITNDVILINRKHQKPIAYQFQGFMVQCLNEFPKIKDKSDSSYRRQLFIPMEKTFTGIERTYIKNDYLKRKEVLEYVLWKVLNSNYYTLSTPDVCQRVLEDYKEYNDPVRQFVAEIEPQLVWNFVPYTFLYDLYKKWLSLNLPGSMCLGRNKFIMELSAIMAKTGAWAPLESKKRVRVGDKMDEPELLIASYDLKNWYSPLYTGHDIQKRCQTKVPEFASGCMRIMGANGDDDDTQ